MASAANTNPKPKPAVNAYHILRKKSSSRVKLPPLMNPPHMILHVVYPAKHPPTIRPLTHNTGVMLRLVPGTVLLAREPARNSLRTALVPTEQMLPVPVEVLAQVAAAEERRGRGAAWVSTAPGAVGVGNTIVV
ncbi:hypothetical protein CNMCM5623_007360 [Aspergillus felis]|uniref:Uncharacterized protein n=1 Tax=Aspergillus felis TaxID=1287682 RepID=A0A8H6V1E6_9EURO|nr:hypothetical protein CNMCM5623_007360 [Aspergillus felis]